MTLKSPKQRAKEIRQGLGEVHTTLSHWGHGRTPTNQQLRTLAEAVQELFADTQLLETLLGQTVGAPSTERAA